MTGKRNESDMAAAELLCDLATGAKKAKLSDNPKKNATKKVKFSANAKAKSASKKAQSSIVVAKKTPTIATAKKAATASSQAAFKPPAKPAKKAAAASSTAALKPPANPKSHCLVVTIGSNENAVVLLSQVTPDDDGSLEAECECMVKFSEEDVQKCRVITINTKDVCEKQLDVIAPDNLDIPSPSISARSKSNVPNSTESIPETDGEKDKRIQVLESENVELKKECKLLMDWDKKSEEKIKDLESALVSSKACYGPAEVQQLVTHAVNTLSVFGDAKAIEKVSFVFNKINEKKSVLSLRSPDVYVDSLVKEQLVNSCDPALNPRNTKVFRSVLVALISKRDILATKNTTAAREKFKKEIMAARNFMQDRNLVIVEKVCTEAFRYWKNDLRKKGKKPVGQEGDEEEEGDSEGDSETNDSDGESSSDGNLIIEQEVLNEA